MHFLGINLLIVLLAAVAGFVLGGLWYSPFLFARPWMVAMGYDPDDKSKVQEMQKGAGKLYALSLLASLVSAFVLAKIVDITTVNSALYGIKVGFAIWLGFVATVQFTDMVFSKRPFKLFLINTGYQLVVYLVMGAILALGSRY
jgi:hypothetical protein